MKTKDPSSGDRYVYTVIKKEWEHTLCMYRDSYPNLLLNEKSIKHNNE